MAKLKLAIVVHAEEEFDWDLGYFRNKTSVTHNKELLTLLEKIFNLDGKVTLAMDYPFVLSESGAEVIQLCKSNHKNNVEFAAHLHPWVTPPFEDDNKKVSERFSYPCNLPEYFELEKLKVLTKAIEDVSGYRPVTYLAGRYGVGENTGSILRKLGYKVDLSISAYSDFSHQYGPDFSQYSSNAFIKDGLTYLPRTSSLICYIPFLQNLFNYHPVYFKRLQQNKLGQVLIKLLGMKRYHLSPEGFTLDQMKQLTKAQLDVNQEEFVLSFHSPSLKTNMTPYVNNNEELKNLNTNTIEYIKWFKDELDGEIILTKDFAQK